MRQIVRNVAQVVILFIAVVTPGKVVLGDVAPPPSEFPMVSVKVPSPVTVFIASAFFGAAVLGVLHKRRLHIGNRWWATAVVLMFLALLSAEVCRLLHSEHHAAHKKSQREKWAEPGNNLTN